MHEWVHEVRLGDKSRLKRLPLSEAARSRLDARDLVSKSGIGTEFTAYRPAPRQHWVEIVEYILLPFNALVIDTRI